MCSIGRSTYMPTKCRVVNTLWDIQSRRCCIEPICCFSRPIDLTSKLLLVVTDANKSGRLRLPLTSKPQPTYRKCIVNVTKLWLCMLFANTRIVMVEWYKYINAVCKVPSLRPQRCIMYCTCLQHHGFRLLFTCLKPYCMTYTLFGIKGYERSYVPFYK